MMLVLAADGIQIVGIGREEDRAAHVEWPAPGSVRPYASRVHPLSVYIQILDHDTLRLLGLSPRRHVRVLHLWS